MLTEDVIKHLRLVDRIKGFDIENYEAVARRSGLTLKQVVDAVELSKLNLGLFNVQSRIKIAKELGLPKDYISGLKDALKLLEQIEAEL